jgi:hypothetical protein
VEERVQPRGSEQAIGFLDFLNVKRTVVKRCPEYMTSFAHQKHRGCRKCVHIFHMSNKTQINVIINMSLDRTSVSREIKKLSCKRHIESSTTLYYHLPGNNCQVGNKYCFVMYTTNLLNYKRNTCTK